MEAPGQAPRQGQNRSTHGPQEGEAYRRHHAAFGISERFGDCFGDGFGDGGISECLGDGFGDGGISECFGDGSISECFGEGIARGENGGEEERGFATQDGDMARRSIES